MAEVTFVSGDDWQGLYVNGRLKVEGHTLDKYAVMDALNQSYHSIEVDQEWLEGEMRLPMDLGDIPQEVRDGR